MHIISAAGEKCVIGVSKELLNGSEMKAIKEKNGGGLWAKRS